MPASFRKHIKKIVDSRYSRHMTENVIIMTQDNHTIMSLHYSHSPAKGLFLLIILKLLCSSELKHCNCHIRAKAPSSPFSYY